MANVTIKIGTRKSRLALWQSNFVADYIAAENEGVSVELIHISTKGDRSQAQGLPLPEIGGKGLFTAELEEALESKEIDIAVHSLKDLPTKDDERFEIAAIPERASAADVLIVREPLKGDVPVNLLTLEEGARVGTSSLRRSSQIKRVRPDISTVSIRGNVDSRMKKLDQYDAIVLARAGLDRLGYEVELFQELLMEHVLPAPGQGALAVQTRRDDNRVKALLSGLHDVDTAAEVSAERAFLNRLGAGCNTPVAAFAKIRAGRIELVGRCLSPEGDRCVEVTAQAEYSLSSELGIQLAEEALKKGASEILKAG